MKENEQTESGKSLQVLTAAGKEIGSLLAGNLGSPTWV